MKRILLITTLFVITVVTANAQFKATSNGVATVDGKDFYVAEIKNKSAEELFNSVESYIMSNFKNPNLVMNKQNGFVINLHGVFADAFTYDKLAFAKGFTYASIDLNLVMLFKDNKIRFNIPNINKMYYNGSTELFFSAGYPAYIFAIYNKKGKVKNEIFLKGFNNFINSLVKEIVDSTTNKQMTNW